jgi:starvation-inducible outer membrane lipoprotein
MIRARRLLTLLAAFALAGCMPPPRCVAGQQLEVIKTDAGPYYYCRTPRP